MYPNAEETVTTIIARLEREGEILRGSGAEILREFTTSGDLAEDVAALLDGIYGAPARSGVADGEGDTVARGRADASQFP